jgi:putrescine transport system substrate-binding protein
MRDLLRDLYNADRAMIRMPIRLARGPAAVAGFCLAAGAFAADRAVHVYNWSDYITKPALAAFQRETGIRVVYDVYDGNEILEAKLLAGRSGYDVVFPTAEPNGARHVAARLYRPLDKARLPNLKHLDAAILASLQRADPGNAHLVPYLWGSTGIGINVGKVRQKLGREPEASWSLIFDAGNAAKLASCGIALLDADDEAFGAALIHLGRDPNSGRTEDLEAAAAALRQLRPHVKYFHASKYIADLANGELCVAQGYSGDIVQARSRAVEAGKHVRIAYLLPREGALVAVDAMAIPADAPHPEAAHAFVDFLLRPGVIADITNEVGFPNANASATALLKPEIRDDPAIYPPAETRARLVGPQPLPPEAQKLRARLWTRIKSGR